MTQNKKIAVTGGIGSGKTAFCDVLRRRGFAVFSCDEISAHLWTERDYLARLASAFPACLTEGAIDKAKVRALVFSDEAARKRLESLSHPAILARLFAEMEKFPVSFAEVPLLYEQGLERRFDGVIALRRPLAQRIASVRERDGLGESAVSARIAAQLDASALDEKDCFLLENDGTAEALERGADAALAHFGLS